MALELRQPDRRRAQQYDCSLDQIPSDINYAPEGQTPNPATFQGLDMIPKPSAGDDLEEVPERRQRRVCRTPLDFGDLTAGGMQPMAGPIFRYNGATAGSGGFPAYYDGSWLINNRGANDGWWKEVKIRNDNNQMLRVHDWLPYNHAGSATAQQNSLVIGTQFGDDGALYMARYPVTCCRNNANADNQVQIVKISFDVYEETDRADDDGDVRPGDARQRPDVHRPGHAELQRDRSGQRRSGRSRRRVVDYIEHRVTLNGVPGPWVRSSNPGLVNPFASSATVSELGAYSVEYRAVDRGGNAEAIKSVTFWINRPTTVTAQGQRDRAEHARAGGQPVGAAAFIPGVTQHVHRHHDRDGHVVVAERRAVGLRPGHEHHQQRPADDANGASIIAA